MIAKTFGMIAIMNQDDLKKQVAQAAKEEVLQRMPKGQYLGIGTGSTANWFIDRHTCHRHQFQIERQAFHDQTQKLCRCSNQGHEPFADLF